MRKEVVEMKSKLTSRKFWLAVAATLGSIATSIEGFRTDNESIVMVGIICAVASVAIYNGCEAAVDKASASGDIYIAESEVEE